MTSQGRKLPIARPKWVEKNKPRELSKDYMNKRTKKENEDKKLKEEKIKTKDNSNLQKFQYSLKLDSTIASSNIKLMNLLDKSIHAHHNSKPSVSWDLKK